MHKSIFQLAKLVDAPYETLIKEPWFIIETFWSSDGPRTRLCDGRWSSESQARYEMHCRSQGQGHPQPEVPVVQDDDWFREMTLKTSDRTIQAVLYGGKGGGKTFAGDSAKELAQDLEKWIAEERSAPVQPAPDIRPIPFEFKPAQPEPAGPIVVEPATPVASSFTAIMYEQYGRWTFQVGHEHQYHVDRVARELKERNYVRYVTVIDVPFVPAPDADKGVWVCVFQRYGSEWRITNGFDTRAAAVKHRDEILVNKKYTDMRFSNVSVRCLPYPEGYRG